VIALERSGEGFRLVQVSDFFYILEDVSGKSRVQQHMKKDVEAGEELYDIIEKIDELGYGDGIEFALAARYFKFIKGTPMSIIEIRRIKETWRVIAYWDRGRERIVLLDAFKAHANKPMNKMLRQVIPLAREAERLLEGY